MVVDVADVEAEGGSNMIVGRSKVEDDVAGSTSIRGRSRSRTLNMVLGGFFKASMPFWISALRCNGLM
uniref:Uncharacterized protein n=1 Tax=Romanomermis culicivorax TaxID=13658 RepID=A0A915JLK3_ROMCU